MARNRKTQVKKYRGPSRPIDPRNAPGAARRQGPDRFGYALIAVGMAFVLLMVIFASVLQGGGTNTASNPPSQAAAPPPADNPQAQATATSVAATQVAITFATRTVGLPTISPTEAKALFDAKNATFFDVREASYYQNGHVPGASNIPYTAAQSRVDEFPKSGNLILYCQ